MTRELRGIKASDAIRAFERAGGQMKSGRGDHINLKMPNGRIITLRSVGDVKLGRLRDAIREGGLTVAGFSELLE